MLNVQTHLYIVLVMLPIILDILKGTFINQLFPEMTI